MVGGTEVMLSSASIAPGGTYMVGVAKEEKDAVVALLTARDAAWAPTNLLPSMPMFSAVLSQEQLQLLLADARVKYVEADGVVSVLPVGAEPESAAVPVPVAGTAERGVMVGGTEVMLSSLPRPPALRAPRTKIERGS